VNLEDQASGEEDSLSHDRDALPPLRAVLARPFVVGGLCIWSSGMIGLAAYGFVIGPIFLGVVPLVLGALMPALAIGAYAAARRQQG
jgi:tetrahydromethanopterin S-methyltransferase subunit B